MGQRSPSSPTRLLAQQVERGGRPIFQVATQLKNGEYVWAPELAPDGPVLVIVNLATQRLIVFRNGVPIARFDNLVRQGRL